ncbi:MAG: MFS transporter [Gammaproteobacteria bacterium]|nr:MFS transporter [Gammaproteobacteria bacterium]MBU1733022.1 MFS transporter [Gammaproteobacteria bacterium]MBU1892070.1 MFS transporter [Gammaproteobacteria bacterium]
MRRFRWIAFTLLILAYVLAFFHRMAPAAIAGELQLAFNASGAALGVLAASYFYIYTLMQIPTGVLVDTLGVRKIATLGGLVGGAGSMLFAYADTLGEASLGRLLVGLGVSVMFISIMKLNAVWFHDRHFGTVGGLTILLGNLGSVLAAAPLVWALNFTSWRSIFAVLGVISIVLGVLTWSLVRNHPGDAGFPSMRELDGELPHAFHSGHWYDGLVKVVKNRATWPGFWPNFGIGGTLFTFAGLWAVPFLHDVYGMSRALAAGHTSLLLAGFALGALLTGVISDRIGRRRPVMVAGIVLYLLCWLPWLGLLQLPLVASLGLFFLMGLGASGFTLAWAVTKEVNPPALSGMATSVVNTGSFLGAGLLQPLVGWVMDLGWDGQISEGVRAYAGENYRIGLLLLFLCALLGLLGALRSRETFCRYS